MSFTPIPVDGFGDGLNLRDKTDAVSEEECIDCLNVVFTERGAVKQRAGYDGFSASLTNRPASLHAHYRAAGTPQLLAGCGTRLEALSNTGTVVASATGLTDGIWDFARFGTPNSEISYAGQGSQILRSWNGSAWGTVASSPQAGALAVMATSNRLVAARFNTTTGGPSGGASTSSPSHIYFSNPGDVTTWDTSNFDQLTPGDGEAIQAVIAWREYVFAFKESKFFVYYGETQDSGGGAVFQNRPVDTGVGLSSPRAVCADESGVYFLDRRGVFRTTGGEPELVSEMISPIFDGDASRFYLGGDLNHANITNCAMWANRGKVYLSFPTSTANDRTLVYDTRRGWWSIWDIPAAAGVSFKVAGEPEVFFGYASGSNLVGRHNNTFTNDDGAAINSRWRSGWFDYGATQQKTIRESKLWGRGKVYLGVSEDFAQGHGSLDLVDMTDATVTEWDSSTWGGGEWSAEQGLVAFLRRRSVRGTVFSTYFANTTLNQEWAVHRLAHHLRESRIPSIKES